MRNGPFKFPLFTSNKNSTRTRKCQMNILVFSNGLEQFTNIF